MKARNEKGRNLRFLDKTKRCDAHFIYANLRIISVCLDLSAMDNIEKKKNF